MSPAKARLAEVSVARPAVEYLEGLQWDVYQEVEGTSGRVDIVGLMGSLTYVIEVKTTLTLEVLAQARRWLDSAHYVSVAVPYARTNRDMACAVCRWLGIGLLEVYPGSDFGGKTQLRVPPVFGRRRAVRAHYWRKWCRPEHKTWAPAGTNGGGYYTPFTGTCQAVREYLKEHGPSRPKDVVAGIAHHYRTDATARSCIPRWAMYGKIVGVETISDAHNRLVLRLAGADK